MSDEPDPGIPRSAAVEIIDPVFEWFVVDKHWTGKIANAFGWSFVTTNTRRHRNVLCQRC